MDKRQKLRLQHVGEQLRGYRIRSGHTTRSVASALGISNVTVSRTELGRRMATRDELNALCALFGVTGQDKLLLIQRATDPQDGAAWLETEVGKRDQQFEVMKRLEREAVSITVFHLALIPGLIQTHEYARIMLDTRDLWSEELDLRVGERVGRQAILSRAQPPRVTLLIDESALLRTLGRPHVLREQLERLLTVQRRDHVSVRVVPFDAPAHPALDGSFLMYELQEGSLHVVVDTHHYGLFLTENADVTLYVETVSHLDDHALSEESTSERIKWAVERLDDQADLA